MEKLKIFLIDQAGHRTTQQLKKYWETNERFELKCDMYFNPLLAEWADYIWVEWCEGTAQEASARKGGINQFNEIRLEHIIQPSRNDYDWSKAFIINRAIDIEVYYGHYKGVNWANMNGLAYVAKHTWEIMNKEMNFAEHFPNLKAMQVPLSIDLDAWTFRKRDGTGRNIAWINHNWSGKGLPLMLQALKRLIDVTKDNTWVLNIVCDWSSEAWFPSYIYHIIKELKLVDNVQWHPKVASIDEFLEKIDYFASSSYKETLSLITAEALAKGIKSVVHNWLGAKDIWPEEMVWSSIDEFVEKILTPYDSEKYREWAGKYDKKFEIEAANKLMGINEN